MKKYLISIVALLVTASTLMGQEDKQALFIKSIYDHTLEYGQCDTWLSYLSEDIGGRLTGSENAATAVDYTHDELKKIEIVDKVWKQACMVPKWERGDMEEVTIIHNDINFKANVLSLGNTIGTGPEGITAEVIEVDGIEILEELGREELAGKVVFFNRPMSNKHINTGYAYYSSVY